MELNYFLGEAYRIADSVAVARMSRMWPWVAVQLRRLVGGIFFLGAKAGFRPYTEYL